MIESLIDAFLKGGLVMLPIAVVSVVLWYLIIERIFFFRRQSDLLDYELLYALEDFVRGNETALRSFSEKSSGVISHIIKKVLSVNRQDRPELERVVKESVEVEMPCFEQHLEAIATLTGVAPLLGLLGTVSGMILSFDVITLSGTGDVHALSRGVAQALITTQLGLIVALPGLLMHTRLENRAQRMIQELNKIKLRMLRFARIK